ncbi:MAG: hypothetical protein ACOC2H_03680 [Spirochaetota bacterium]
MKEIRLVLILLLVTLPVLSCEDSTSSDDGGKVTISNEIDAMAREHDNFPDDAEIVDTEITIEMETVNGTESTDVGTTEGETANVNVTIPDSLLSRATYSGFEVQVWINGTFITIEHDGTKQVVSTPVTLQVGSNVLCAVITVDGKTYRSAVIHIFYRTLDTNLISRWVRTGSDYDTSGEDEGFEITADGFLYDLEFVDGSWNRVETLAENIVADNGVLTSYNSDHPAASGYKSSYTLSDGNNRVAIVEGTNTIYGVRFSE